MFAQFLSPLKPNDVSRRMPSSSLTLIKKSMQTLHDNAIIVFLFIANYDVYHVFIINET